MSQPLAALPSVDRLLRDPASHALIAEHGRPAVTDAIRAVLGGLRAAQAPLSLGEILRGVAALLERDTRPSLRPVFNLTGTVLHTNLGRALLPAEAIAAMTTVASSAANLEYELGEGRR